MAAHVAAVAFSLLPVIAVQGPELVSAVALLPGGKATSQPGNGDQDAPLPLLTGNGWTRRTGDFPKSFA